MMDNTAHLDLTDKYATSALDNTISEIENLRLKQGLKDGRATAILDEQGNVVSYKMDPSLNLQITKDISDGLSKAINNLNAAGDAEGAQYLVEKYGARLDSINKAKVVEKTKKLQLNLKGCRSLIKFATWVAKQL